MYSFIEKNKKGREIEINVAYANDFKGETIM